MNVRQFIKILRARQKRKSWFSRGFWVHSSGLIRITDLSWKKLQKLFKNSGNKLTKSVFSSHTSQMSITTSTNFLNVCIWLQKLFNISFSSFFLLGKSLFFLFTFSMTLVDAASLNSQVKNGSSVSSSFLRVEGEKQKLMFIQSDIKNYQREKKRKKSIKLFCHFSFCLFAHVSEMTFGQGMGII